jgi:hypothetical protein
MSCPEDQSNKCNLCQSQLSVKQNIARILSGMADLLHSRPRDETHPSIKKCPSCKSPLSAEQHLSAEQNMERILSRMARISSGGDGTYIEWGWHTHFIAHNIFF